MRESLWPSLFKFRPQPRRHLHAGSVDLAKLDFCAPVLTAEEAGELLRSIATDSVVGLRDRA
jgi:hypothetical protein